MSDRPTVRPSDRPSVRPTVRPSDRPSDRTYPYQAGTHIPHPLCRESYHLGSHFGTIWGWIGWILVGFKMVFLVILGLLKFVKKSPTLSLGECRDGVPTLPLWGVLASALRVAVSPPLLLGGLVGPLHLLDPLTSFRRILEGALKALLPCSSSPSISATSG